VFKRILSIFILIFLPATWLAAQNYLWPTNASPYMSSSFCEYRPGHYHSALDIKTWNREGYPIFAVADGKVYKIHVSPFGYGKVLYLKLRDGRWAVYAHLQRFSPELEQAIWRKQLKQRRYSVTFKPENWRVKKGQVLGYTGQTGIGVPHLHFEIRCDERHPINPLHYYQSIKDHIPPRLKELALIPQDEHSLVDGSFLPKIIRLKQIGKGQYEMSRPVPARGIVGLAVNGYDRADGVYNKFNFYSLEMHVDGQLRFHLQYDTLDFNLTRQVEIETDHPLHVDSGRVFHKLYIEPFNQLNFYRRSLGNGLLKIDRDTVRFTITAADFFHNQSVIKGVLVPRPEINMALKGMKQLHQALFLRLNLPNPLSGLFFSQPDQRNKWRPIRYYEILQRKFLGTRQEMLIRLPVSDSSASRLNISLELADGTKAHRFIALRANDLPDPAIHIDNLGKYLAINLQPGVLVPKARLRIQSGDYNSVDISHPTSTGWQSVFPARDLQNDTLRISWLSGNKAVLDTQMVYHIFYPGRSQSWTFFSDSLRIHCPAGTFYDTLFFQVRKEKIVDSTFCGSGFVLHAWPQVLKKRIQISLSVCKPQKVFWRQLGIYKRGGRGRWSFAGAAIDSAERRVSTHISSFGQFAVLADTTAPQVQWVEQVKMKRRTASTPMIFSVRDSFSGIDIARNIKAAVDGEWALPEWDPERKQVRIRPQKRLVKGEHFIDLWVQDEAGNKTRRLQYITVH